MSAGDDFRSALRQIRRRPGLAATIVLMLGLAMSTSTAVFSYANALLLRPAPWRDPGRLVEIRSVRGGEPGKLTMWEIEEIQRSASSIESMAAHSGAGGGGYNFGGEGRPEEWRAVLTTGNLFEVLGVPLVQGGRWPLNSDRERDFRVVITHGVWKRAFGGGPVVGKTITLDHAPGYVIHGVAPEDFDFPSGVEVYRSIGGFTNYLDRTRRNVVGIARLKAGVTPARLATELRAVADRLAREYPETNGGLQIAAISLLDQVRGPARPYMWTLLIAVSWVLLIASFNAATLLLARSVERARELGMRVVLGAQRGQIIRQLAIESSVLSAAGCVFGLGLGLVWMRFVEVAVAFELPAWMRVDFDARVIAFASLTALCTGLLAAVLPAFHATRAALAPSLRATARGSSAAPGLSRMRDVLVIAQVMMAFALFSGAGLVVRGFGSLLDADRGFQSDGISTFRVALGWKRYDAARTIQYYEQAVEKLSEVPGISGVAFVDQPPLSRQGVEIPAEIQAEHQSLEAARQNPYVVRQQVSDSYFDLVRIPIERGRAFSQFDGPNAERVVIVSRGLAGRLWPGEDPLGKRLRNDPTRKTPLPWLTVVGVARDVAHRDLAETGGFEIYEPFRQSGTANQYILARTSLPMKAFQQAAERALWAIDPEQSLFDFKTYDDRILAGIWPLRLSERLLIVFSVAAFFLAAAGTAAALTHAGRQRIQEIGVRLVMGSSAASIRTLILLRGLGLGAVGLLLGVTAALGLGAVLSKALPGIPIWDPASLVLALGLFTATIVLVGLRPAIEAGRVDPIVLLREE